MLEGIIVCLSSCTYLLRTTSTPANLVNMQSRLGPSRKTTACLSHPAAVYTKEIDGPQGMTRQLVWLVCYVHRSEQAACSSGWHTVFQHLVSTQSKYVLEVGLWSLVSRKARP